MARRWLRQQLLGRRDLLLESLQAAAPQAHVEHRPVGGLNLWARLPDGTDERALVRECESRGLLISPGDEWFPAEPSAPYVRLNYSADDPGRFAEAGQLLGDALQAVA
jgi:DNA-binding transcriptional MocR family regulator